jgi:formiminoglutamase
MTWNSCYAPPDPALWQGRQDSPPNAYFFQIMQMLDLQKTFEKKAEVSFALLGFCSDEGIRRNFGRVGAVSGPTAIREALAKFPVQKSDFECFDAGNILCINGDLEASQKALGEVIHLLLKNKINPVILGGGHELAYGHYQGLELAFPDKNLGIINFDSHLDMRPLLDNDKGSSGTPFLQIAQNQYANKKRFDYNCVGVQHAGNSRLVIDIAKKHDAKIIWADELHQGQLEKCVDFIDRVIDQNEIIYLSLCLDVFASAFAPGVSAVQPLGLFPWHIIPLIRQLAASGKVISYDIAELSPGYDVDGVTAKLAASLIFEFIHHHNEMPREW